MTGSWPAADAIGSELRNEINGNILHLRGMLRYGTYLGFARSDCLVGLGLDGPIRDGHRRIAVGDGQSGFGDTGERVPALWAGREALGVYRTQECMTSQPVNTRRRTVAQG
jgi:hypothetical protein